MVPGAEDNFMQLRSRIISFPGFNPGACQSRTGDRGNQHKSGESFHNLSIYQIQKGRPVSVTEKGKGGQAYFYKVTTDALSLVFISVSWAGNFLRLLISSIIKAKRFSLSL